MAQRADTMTPRQARRQESRNGNFKPGRYYLVHSDQLYSLQPVDVPVTYEAYPKPIGPMDPMSEEVCDLEPASRPVAYGPGLKNESYAQPTGFFLDRYVY
jgi:hypothetical protein